MSPEAWAAIASLTFTIVTSTAGSIVWVRQRSQTRLAQQLLKASEQARLATNAERDFNHLKGNYQQLSQGQALIVEEIREVKQKLSEVETLLLSAKVIDRRGVSRGDSV